MVREIVKDVILLGQKSTDATVADIKTAMDLVDTLEANRNACVGMAANMIGVKKRIIAINDNGFTKLMINPTITAKSSKFETEEGCLSLSGVRPTTRYKNITVKYLDMNFKEHTENFTGWTAQIIQHEVDHCDGIVI
ncbi:MAG: peptide deformylase [Ruminococcus sp.]|nr:peptide deformylase [Ruminococcus sp.]MDD5890886.1 peptide deformylase [Ruminococcus sp.]